MKFQIHERDECFYLSMEAETVADAAMLARLGLNHVTKGSWIQSTAFKEGSFSGTIAIGKRTAVRSSIERP